MANINANDIQIEYETYGNSKSPVILLIAGLGAQMLYWQTEFCVKLAANGYYVIRFDNRDTGLSARLEGLSMAEVTEKTGALFMGKTPSVPYGFEDMADDAIGLLDALGIGKAHICGMSMGGYIAQTFCLNHPSRALSLISIYSHTGNRNQFLPTQNVLEAMLTPPPEEREEYIDHMTRFLRLVYGSGLPFDESFHRSLVKKSYDRSFCIEGAARHFLATLTQKDRTSGLRQLTLPTLVVHGDDDPLVPLAGGKATADAIPNSTFKVFNGMGHVMPNLDAYWSDILDAMVSHLGQVKI